MSFEFTAEQIRSALMKAIEDDEPDEIKQSLAAMLAIHYPEEFDAIRLALDLVAILRAAS